MIEMRIQKTHQTREKQEEKTYKEYKRPKHYLHTSHPLSQELQAKALLDGANPSANESFPGIAQ